MSRDRVIAVGIVLMILIVGGVAVFTRGFGFFTIKTSDNLTFNGNVDIRQVDLGFRVGGRISEIAIEEGAHVKSGDRLAAIDTQPLRDQLAADNAQVDNMSAQLAKQVNGNRPQDIAQADAKVADLRAQLSNAKQAFDRNTSMVSAGATSKANYDSARSQFLALQAQLQSADEAFSLQKAGARVEDIEAAQAQRAQAIAQRDKTCTDIADAELHAPNDGVILTRAREPGAIVQAGETVLTLTIDRPMRIRAYVDEADLSRIFPDVAVEVTADGNAKVYHGTIGYISPTAEFTPKTVQTRELRTDLVYRIRLIITDPDDALRQGQPVTVRVSGARSARKE